MKILLVFIMSLSSAYAWPNDCSIRICSGGAEVIFNGAKVFSQCGSSNEKTVHDARYNAINSFNQLHMKNQCSFKQSHCSLKNCRGYGGAVVTLNRRELYYPCHSGSSDHRLDSIRQAHAIKLFMGLVDENVCGGKPKRNLRKKPSPTPLKYGKKYPPEQKVRKLKIRRIPWEREPVPFISVSPITFFVFFKERLEREYPDYDEYRHYAGDSRLYVVEKKEDWDKLLKKYGMKDRENAVGFHTSRHMGFEIKDHHPIKYELFEWEEASSVYHEGINLGIMWGNLREKSRARLLMFDK